MKKGQVVPAQVKELIIQKVKDGIPIKQLAQEYDIYHNTIRRWCKEQMESGTTSRSDALLISRLQKQNRELMEIIGELTLENRVGIKKSVNKTLLCRVLNLNRSSLYHQSIQESKDCCLAIKIQEVMLSHPFFGAKRLSWELSEILSRPINHKRVSRVMLKYNLQCQKRGVKYRKNKI